MKRSVTQGPPFATISRIRFAFHPGYLDLPLGRRFALPRHVLFRAL